MVGENDNAESRAEVGKMNHWLGCHVLQGAELVLDIGADALVISNLSLQLPGDHMSAGCGKKYVCF